QMLSQINPERTPGLGTSSQLAITKNGCLTPASIVTATTNWRWAYSDTTTTDHDGDLALNVPAGTITTVPGAWLSVTPMPPNPAPTADFHIWGSGVGNVNVTMRPLDASSLVDGWSKPIVFHNLDDPAGSDLYWTGTGLTQNPDGTVTFTTKT